MCIRDSTNSTNAIGALSPERNPHFKIRKYPPGRELYLGPSSTNSLLTAFLSRSFENACLLFETVSILANVIKFNILFLIPGY